MIRFCFKLLLIMGITLWAIKSNASGCKKAGLIKPSVERATGVFKVNALNLREGSGKQFCIKKVLRNVKGKSVNVIGFSGDWRLTSYNGEELWVHKSLITIKLAIPSIYVELI